MPTFWALPLRRQLLLAIPLLLVPVVVAAIWSVLETRRERLDDLGAEAESVGRTIAAYLARDVAIVDQAAAQIAATPELRSFDAAGLAELFARVDTQSEMLAGFSLVRTDGAVVAAEGITPEPPHDQWSGASAAISRRIVLAMRTSPAGGRLIPFVYPIADDSGRVVAALTVGAGVRRIQEVFGSIPLPEGGVVTVAERDGSIIARSADSRRFVGTAAAAPAANTGESVVRFARGDDGDRLIAEIPVEQVPWIVAVALPTSIADERTAAIWSRSLAILGLGIAGWLTMAVVLSRRLADSVSHLDATAQRIAAGDFSAMERKPMLSREFAELQDAFDAMLKRFNATRQMLDAQMAEERRIRTELESLQGQVIRQERLAAVGQLVSGVAHEINNPLQAILGFAELLQMQGDVSESVRSDLKLIQKESARACGIIRNLALFARQQPGAAAPVHMVDVMTAVAELRQRRLESEDIHLHVEDVSTQPVMAVVTELQQVVLNFVVNAEQAILASGRLPGRITMRAYDKEGRVVLEVEDTGPGVKPADEAKLFQPFFTTKPVGQGTGLGLSISYGIIDSLGGQIGYRTAPAGGSVFYFTLPAAGSEARTERRQRRM
jgi:signal transduction histidine kinase